LFGKRTGLFKSLRPPWPAPLPGEVWIADIPFTSGLASKLRPVLILWTDSADSVVAAVTSAQPRSTTDVSLAKLVSG
ncbi:MAG TPA: hypothetical protein VGN61_03665, partial [Verrucomicrobiae bacterium]